MRNIGTTVSAGSPKTPGRTREKLRMIIMNKVVISLLLLGFVCQSSLAAEPAANNRKRICIGKWSPDDLKAGKYTIINLHVNIKALVEMKDLNGNVNVEFFYTHGSQRLDIKRVYLIAGDKMLGEDKHAGYTGGRKSGNIYTIALPEQLENREIRLCAEVLGGNTDSFGEILLTVKKRVLILGDSTSMRYAPILKGIYPEVDIVRPGGNHQGTITALKNLEEWLGKKKWDVIHFNFGLHDFRHVDAKTGEFTHNQDDPFWAPPEQYRKNLETIVKRLKETGAVLIFATTTPVPPDERYGGIDKRMSPVYNKIALEIMRENDVVINDLYNYTLPNLAEWQQKRDVHFHNLGSTKIAEKVRDTIKTELARPMDKPFLVFGEDHTHQILTKRSVQKHWLSKPPNALEGIARPGEYYTFQLGLFAAKDTLPDVKVEFTGLKSGEAIIPAEAITCFNLGGINDQGQVFSKTVSVAKGDVQPLWCGVMIPKQAKGVYTGTATVTAGGKSQSVSLNLEISGKPVTNFGDDNPKDMTRLRWLNSTIGAGDDVLPPFKPVRVKRNAVHILGRRLKMGPDGLPVSIASTFNQAVLRTDAPPTEILAAPVRFIVETETDTVNWEYGALTFEKTTDAAASWHATSTAEGLVMKCEATIEYDGFVSYDISLHATRDIAVKDIRVEFPIRAEAATHVAGMGQEAGRFNGGVNWKWNPKVSQDSLWIGTVNAGIMCRFKGANYRRPLIQNYPHAPLRMPESWANPQGGQLLGGCDVSANETEAVLNAYSGPRRIGKDEVLHYRMDLYLTPFKPLDIEGQWKWRYYHPEENDANMSSDDWVSTAKAAGANMVAVHSGPDINPFINYPFLDHTVGALKDLAGKCRAAGLAIKPYYTTRELSCKASELRAFQSLDGEILLTNPNGGYVGAWVHKFRDDSIYKGTSDPSLATASTPSRWHNYYLEGLDWLCRNIGLDGLYLDGLSFDRKVMQRIRRILNGYRKDAQIDMHFGHFFDSGRIRENTVLIYMEFMPYLDRIWAGERYPYWRNDPDWWLIACSGIPFGTMGEMLSHGGHPWRGMIYGMTSRYGWSSFNKKCDPRPVWRILDEFGISDSEMIGYWCDDCPVQTGRKDILATVYRGKKKTLISIASWAKGKQEIRLNIDWKALGIDPANAVLRAPESVGFQPGATWKPTDPIVVEENRGWLIILE